MAAKGRAPKEFIPDYAGDVSAEFDLWLEDVNDYLSICEVTDNDDKRKLFLNLAGLSVRKVVKGLVVPQDAEDPYKALMDTVKAHFRSSVNTTSERHKCRQLRQLPDESVSAFIARLRAKADLCEFESTSVTTVENTQICDQLIVGLKSALRSSQGVMSRYSIFQFRHPELDHRDDDLAFQRRRSWPVYSYINRT